MEKYDSDKQFEILLRRYKEIKKLSDEAELLRDDFNDAEQEALNYCNRTDPAIGMATSIRDLAKLRFNQRDVEGETSRSEGGVSQSFEEGIPKKIRSQLNGYRVARARKLS
ncbi:phage head-tail connector protein [Carnobacterium antarcticum]|uniref:Phage head-tail connector protein n=1 Tax=Carnobacterium antarcticum TaxID=2126436 RepID=A0ABW4NML1_9LACT|nr:phage head-tail connector protein [Carnobacterium sp. CP1]ALV20758.1 hypothetical protein NY10_133 [Carnobacterium sp. CP1]